ncbi:hypothetical protein WKH57_01345 [Niallia taxi]|uniref:hypothetical protein n=1 Tax=Niallia taxi TaxID=2499688 RepID=UPI0031815216
MDKVYVVGLGHGAHRRNFLGTTDIVKAVNLYVEYIKNDDLEIETDNPYMEVFIDGKKVENFSRLETDVERIKEYLESL